MSGKTIVIRPWEDLPACPQCKLPAGAPDGVYQGSLGCLNCGAVWVASTAELEQSRRADKAWETEQDRQDREARERKEAADLQRKYELAKAGKLW